MLRSNDNYLLLLIYSYASHTRYNTLKFLQENRIIVIGMPAHTSHILQPLDFSVFSIFKSFISKEFSLLIRIKKFIDAFDVANVHLCIRLHTPPPKIRGSFHKFGAWDFICRVPSCASLLSVLGEHGHRSTDPQTSQTFLTAFDKQSRTLLEEPSVEVT